MLINNPFIAGAFILTLSYLSLTFNPIDPKADVLPIDIDITKAMMMSSLESEVLNLWSLSGHPHIIDFRVRPPFIPDRNKLKVC